MKQYIMKNNFSAGELAPTLYTRTDIQQYGNGAKTLRNVIPLVEGGVRKRPGTGRVAMFRLPESGCHRLEASLSYEDCEVPPGVDSAKEQVAGYVGTR